eukprot:gene1541-1088_t
MLTDPLWRLRFRSPFSVAVTAAGAVGPPSLAQDHFDELRTIRFDPVTGEQLGPA